MRTVSSGTIYYYAEDMLGRSRTIVRPGETWERKVNPKTQVPQTEPGAPSVSLYFS